MKTLKYIFLLILVMGTFQSCLVENETKYDLNDDGKNLAGFELNRTSLSFVSNGEEYDFTVRVKVVGPTVKEMSNPVTMTVSADAEAMENAAAADTNLTPAIEGVHFRIDNPSLTLSSDDNYLNLFPITILTAGLEAPLSKKPVIVLKVTNATGDPNIVNNGKPISITLNYGCFSNLAGTYDVHTVITRAVSGGVTEYDWTETITRTGVGEYRTEVVGYAGYIEPGTGTAGFTFLDVCDVLTVPEQNLVDLYSNLVYGNNLGSVDPVTGNLHMEYTVTTAAAAGFRVCVSDYVKVSK